MAQAAQQFPKVILWLFQTQTGKVLDAQLALMSDLALSRFSHHYYVETRGAIAPVMVLAAQKMSPLSLVRLRAAFGAANIDSAVTSYAPAAVRAGYAASTKRAVIKQSHAAHMVSGAMSFTMSGVPQGVASPNTSMTLGEIYEEYLWTSATTELEAFALMARYAALELNIAWAAGYKVGSEFYQFATTIDPDYGWDITTGYGVFMSADFGDISGVATAPEVYIDNPDFYDIQYWDFTNTCVFTGGPCAESSI